MDLNILPKLHAFSQHTTVFIEPTKLDDFCQAFTPIYERTSAVPQCLYFEVFEDPAVPGKITWVVNWNASPEWVMTQHLEQDYSKPYFAAVEPLFTKPFEIQCLKRETSFVSGKKANFERTIGSNNEGCSLHVTVEIKSECVEQFKDEWRKIFPPVASEPECLYFEVFSHPDQPGKFSWMENWSASVEWLMSVQLAKDYYKPYLAATEPMFSAERVFTLLKRKEGFVARKEANFEGAYVGDFKG